MAADGVDKDGKDILADLDREAGEYTKVRPSLRRVLLPTSH